MPARSRRPPAGFLGLVLAVAACGLAQPSVTGPSANGPASPGAIEPSSAPASGNVPSGPGAVLTSITVRRLALALPTPVSRAVAFAANGVIIVCGGLLASGSTTPAIVRLDPAAGTASSIGSLAVAVHDAAGAALGATNLVFGGGNATPLSTVQTCEPTGASAVVGTLPAARADLSAVTAQLADGALNGLIVGGAGATPQADVVATPDGRRMTTVGQLSIGVRYAAVVALGSSVIVVGGFRNGGDITDIQVLDLRSGQVQVVGHLPWPLAHASAFVERGRIVIAGGARNGQRQRSIWGIDPGSWTVEGLGALPFALSDAATVVVGEAAYLIGGEAATGTVGTVLELRPA